MLVAVLALLATTVPSAAAATPEQNHEAKPSQSGANAAGIVGGFNTPGVPVPWMVSITRLAIPDPGGTGLGKCGGAHIGAQFILTAAHCVTTEVGGVVSAVGAGDLSVHLTKGGTRGTGTQVTVTSVNVHPSYLLSGFEGRNVDLAVLKLATAPAGSYAALAKVDFAPQQYSTHANLKPDLAFVGYGRATDNGPASNSLKAGFGSLMPSLGPSGHGWPTTCYAATSANAANLCVQQLSTIDGKACHGDSGGPVGSDDLTKVYGIMSKVSLPATNPVCSAGTAILAVNVWSQRCWINEMTGGGAWWHTEFGAPTLGLPPGSGICAETTGEEPLCSVGDLFGALVSNYQNHDRFEAARAEFDTAYEAYLDHGRQWQSAYDTAYADMPTWDPYIRDLIARTKANQAVGKTPPVPEEPPNPLINAAPCAWALDPVSGYSLNEVSPDTTGTGDINGQPATTLNSSVLAPNGAGVMTLNAPGGGTPSSTSTDPGATTPAPGGTSTPSTPTETQGPPSNIVDVVEEDFLAGTETLLGAWHYDPVAQCWEWKPAANGPENAPTDVPHNGIYGGECEIG